METKRNNSEGENPLSNLTENLKEYVGVQTEIVRLEVTDKLAASGSYIALAAVLGLVGFLTVLFVGLTAGYYLSELLGSSAKGFAVVGGALFLKFLILYVFRKKLILEPIRNMIIEKSFQPKDDDGK